MKINKHDTKEQIILKMIQEIHNSPANIGQKIQAFIKIRRENHNNEEIQNNCNKYLDELYNKKYEMLSKGESIW